MVGVVCSSQRGGMRFVGPEAFDCESHTSAEKKQSRSPVDKFRQSSLLGDGL